MIDWKSVKLDGYPPEQGRYWVTIEGIIEDLKEGPEPGERIVTIAYYYGRKGWGILEGMIGRVMAWAKIPEGYTGE